MMTLDKTELTLSHYCGNEKPLHQLVIGLTGNPGAGKSTIAAMMKAKGALIIDGDQLGYEMLQQSSPTYFEIVKTFGESIVNEDGEISRAKLGSIVFQDQSKLDALNQIVHPPMLKQILDRIQGFRETHIQNDKMQPGPLVLDAALLLEWDISDWFDVVIVVTAPKELRHQRYVQYKGSSAERVNHREAAQLSEDVKINRADILIVNDAGIDALQYKVNHLFQENYQE